MKVVLWGTRGSLASAGPDTVRYGGDTSAVEVQGPEGEVIVLDAGSGVRRLGSHLPADAARVDVLLTHLHMDHIQGLGFFDPLFRPGVDVHIWGPVSATMRLEQRLGRYLSPPLFPVRLRELQALHLHDVKSGESFEIGGVRVRADLVIHPGPTVGYRLETRSGTLAYLPDHEPALGSRRFPDDPDWTSGFELAAGVDVLIHDAQYTASEYDERVGWGHSSIGHTIAFATMAEVERLVTFHHEPTHSDEMLDQMTAEARAASNHGFELIPGMAGTALVIE